MATVIENLFVAIRADSKGLDSDLKGALGKFKKLENVGANLSRKISLPILALSGIILKMAGDFESAMNTVAAKSGATAEEFKKLTALAEKLGATTRFSATQAAQGMAFLAQAGFDTNQILAALPATLNLASAGNLELARAADIASNVLKGFRLPAEEAGRAADVLAFSAAKTNTDVEELGAAMSRIAPVAVDLGFSMESTAAAIGVMSDAGVKGFRAGTALRAIFVRLAAATGKGAEAMDRLKISVRDTDGNFVGLADVIDQFAEAEKNAADKGQFFADKAAIFGQEMISSAGILIAKGAPAFRELTREIDNAAGASQKMTDIMERGFVGGTRVLISALESLAISIGNTGLLKLAEDMTRSAAEFIRGVAAMDKGVLAFATSVAGIAAAVPLLLLAIGLIGPAFITGAAAVASASVAMVAAVGTFSLAVSTGLVGALTAAEIAVGALGAAAIAAAAAFVAWKIGKWAADNIGPVAALGDFLADLVPQSLIDRFTGVTAAMSAMEFTTAALEKKLKKWGVTVERGNMTLGEYSAALRVAGVESGIAAAENEFWGLAVAGAGDKVELAGTKIKSFSEKVADSVKGLRDAAENVKISAAAWNIWAEVLDKAEAAQDRFSLALSKMEVPLGIVTGKMMGLSSQVKQAIEDFKASGPPLLTMADNLQTVASQGDKVRLALSAIPIELAKLTPGQELLRGIMEALKAAKEQAGSFAEAMRLLAFDANFAKLTLEDQARVVGELREQWKEFTGESERTRKAQEELNAAINDVSGILADAVLGFVSLGEAMKNFAINIVGGFLQSAFKALLTDMLTQDAAIKKLTDSWRSFLGIFGGGKGKTPSVPGDVSTGGGGAGGDAGGILAGPVGVITAIGSLVSQIIGNFQLARIEGSLNKIELNTRETTRALTGAPELLAQSAQSIGVSAGKISDASRGFAIGSATNAFNDPSTFVPTNTTPTPVARAPGLPLGPAGPEEGVGATGPQQGLGVLQVLFEQSDFMQDQLGQLKFQTDSLDTLKGQAGRSEGLLEAIRDSLSGLGSIGFGGAVVPALLGEINEALRVGSDLITAARNQVAAVRQQFVFDRDIVQVTRDQQLRRLEDILKELKGIVFNTGQPQQLSIAEFGQATFRNQLGPEGVLP